MHVVPCDRQARLQAIRTLAASLGWTPAQPYGLWELPGTDWKLRITGLGIMLYKTRAGMGATHQHSFETFQLKKLAQALQTLGAETAQET